MQSISREAAQFLQSKADATRMAGATAAAFLGCGIDLARIGACPEQRAAAALRLGRLLERERQKGARGHWSYDLNRHIALKQALDIVKSV